MRRLLCTSFWRHETNLEDAREPVSAEKPLSLIGSVALWSGWVSDLEFMHKQTLVIKPKNHLGVTSRSSIEYDSISSRLEKSHLLAFCYFFTSKFDLLHDFLKVIISNRDAI